MSADEIKNDAKQGRRGDGGVYLVVAEDNAEFGVALRYAARRAQAHRAHVGILHVINIDDFQHWGKVEEMMMQELRAEAEKQIWAHAKTVNDLNGIYPVLYFAEGHRTDTIIEVIDQDENIRTLILGGAEQASGPGPLVSYFTGKGLAKLRVPVVVVPGHLEMQKIDSISL